MFFTAHVADYKVRGALQGVVMDGFSRRAECAGTVPTAYPDPCQSCAATLGVECDLVFQAFPTGRQLCSFGLSRLAAAQFPHS